MSGKWTNLRESTRSSLIQSMSQTWHKNKTVAGCECMKIYLTAQRFFLSDQKHLWEISWGVSPYPASTLSPRWQRLEAMLETPYRSQRETQARHFQRLRFLIQAKRWGDSDEVSLDPHATRMIIEMAQGEIHIVITNKASKRTKEIKRTLTIQGAPSTDRDQEARILTRAPPLLTSRSRLHVGRVSSQIRVLSQIWYQKRCNPSSFEDSLACRKVSRRFCWETVV